MFMKKRIKMVILRGILFVLCYAIYYIMVRVGGLFIEYSDGSFLGFIIGYTMIYLAVIPAHYVFKLFVDD